MLDIKKIRNNTDDVLKALSKKDNDISLNDILNLDSKLKSLTTKLNELQAEQNSKSKEVGQLKSKGESSDNIFKDLKVLSEKAVQQTQSHVECQCRNPQFRII